MNRFRLRHLRGFDDPLAAQIALARGRRSNQNRLIRLADVRGPHVGLAVDRDRFYPKLVAGANDPQSDLATIRDENFLEHQESADVRVSALDPSERNISVFLGRILVAFRL